MLDGDGTAVKNVVASSIYEKFITGLQRVLYSCGIESRLFLQTEVPEHRKDCNRKPLHRLKLITKYSVDEMSKIPQLCKKLHIITNTQWANSFPMSFCDESMMSKHCLDKRNTSISIDKYEKLVGKMNYCPVTVRNVVASGNDHTYDITVEDQHNFYCNGYLSHNTAEMFMFEPDDYEVLFAKYGINGFYTTSEIDHHIQLSQELEKFGIKPFWFDQITEMFHKSGRAQRIGLNHRHLSNNSIMFPERPTFAYLQLLFQILRYEGEPGLINQAEMKRRRPNAELVNPCGEIILDSCQTCNLTTVNLTAFIENDDQGRPVLNKHDLFEAQKLSARSGMRMTLVTLELPEWDVKQKRDRLIGTSLTGIKDALDKLGYTKEQEMELMHELGEVIRKESARYAKEIRIPTPLLATTIKPEGSLSQLAGGISQGLHLSHSPYFIRRIRINSHDPMAEVIKKTNWTINPEVGTPGATYEEKMANARSFVIDFPVASSAQKTKYQTTIEEQLDTYFNYQKVYADHNCSNTISVKDDEWVKLPQIIYDHWDEYLGITFIPLDGGHYELAPYEECSQATYQQMKTTMMPFDFKQLTTLDQALHVDDDDSEESVTIMADETLKSDCAGGICPVR